VLVIWLYLVFAYSTEKIWPVVFFSSDAAQAVKREPEEGRSPEAVKGYPSPAENPAPMT
jgi:hypothetical protein